MKTPRKTQKKPKEYYIAKCQLEGGQLLH